MENRIGTRKQRLEITFKVYEIYQFHPELNYPMTKFMYSLINSVFLCLDDEIKDWELLSYDIDSKMMLPDTEYSLDITIRPRDLVRECNYMKLMRLVKDNTQVPVDLASIKVKIKTEEYYYLVD